MATSQADMAAPSPMAWVAFAKKRQFAWKTALLAVLTVGLGLVVLSKHAMAAQAYLVLLIAVHVGGLVVLALRTEKRDLAPSAFGLFWRLTGLAVMIALLAMVRLQPDSPWFWPTLAGIWVLHTGGLAMLHVRAAEGAPCPFLPASWQKRA
jgi:FtsH-binding integral membrane protein